MHDKTSSTIQM